MPVLRDGALVGIVSRADLLRGFALHPAAGTSADDRELRERLTVELEQAGLTWHPYVNIVVSDAVVHLWGIVPTREEADALRAAAEGVSGVALVESHLAVRRTFHAV